MTGEIFVHRNTDTTVEALGALTVPDQHFGCLTLERPDKNNQRGISCIPKGSYDWVKIAATQKIPYEHILINNVPGRSGVCIHSANYVHQLEGCIAVGQTYADMNKDGQLDVTSSKDTFLKLMAVLPKFGRLHIS